MNDNVKKLQDILLENPDIHIRLVNVLGELKKVSGDAFSADDLFLALALGKKAYQENQGQTKGGYGAEFQQHYEQMVAK